MGQGFACIIRHKIPSRFSSTTRSPLNGALPYETAKPKLRSANDNKIHPNSAKENVKLLMIHSGYHGDGSVRLFCALLLAQNVHSSAIVQFIASSSFRST